MKLQAIKKCCNDTGTYVLFNCPDGQQWISNGTAMWPVEGITLTEEAIPALFDITEKKREETSIRAVESTDERFQIVPIHTEAPLEEVGLVLVGGRVFRVLDSLYGVLMINTELEKPAQKPKTDLRYFLRAKEGRVPLVAIYADMFVAGLVLPLNGKAAQKVLDEMARVGSMHARPVTKEDLEPDEETGEQLSVKGERNETQPTV